MEEASFSRCKKLMVFFNILFLLGGLALLAMGIWVVIDFSHFSATLGTSNLLFQYAAYISMTVGGITVILSLCGCIGAWKESKCLLMIFSTILIVLALVEVGVAILAFAFPDETDTIIRDLALDSIKSEYGTSTASGIASTESWNIFQATFKCCGYNNGNDYTGSVFDVQTATANTWPLSCCTLNSAGVYADQTKCQGDTSIFTDTAISHASLGCSSQIKTTVKMYTTIVGGIALGVLLIQILAITFACCVSSNIGKSNQVNAWN